MKLGSPRAVLQRLGHGLCGTNLSIRTPRVAITQHAVPCRHTTKTWSAAPLGKEHRHPVGHPRDGCAFPPHSLPHPHLLHATLCAFLVQEHHVAAAPQHIFKKNQLETDIATA